VSAQAHGSRIWLLRHAESEWNAARRWQGHGDPPLSERGRATATARARELARQVSREGRRLRLFCSDLRRARDTAEALGAVLGLTATPDAALRELDVGRWTGLHRGAIEDRDPALLAAFESGDPEVRPGQGETRAELRTRVRDAVEQRVAEDPGADLLLVVHLGVIRALIPGAEPDHLELFETDLDAIRRARSPDAAGG